MALSFPRSVRALGSDRFRPSLITLALVCILLIIWLGWFFFTPVPVYESSSTLRVERNGFVVVTFPAATLRRLHAGQPATLQITAPGSPAETLEGEVIRVRPAGTTGEGTVQVHFAALTPLPAGAQAAVQVQSALTTPAGLLLQAIREPAALAAQAAPATTGTPTP
jgi:hypothetical protein